MEEAWESKRVMQIGQRSPLNVSVVGCKYCSDDRFSRRIGFLFLTLSALIACTAAGRNTLDL